MKSIIGLKLGFGGLVGLVGLVGLGMSFLVHAQNIPTLAKVYTGNTTETSINSSKKNPKT